MDIAKKQEIILRDQQGRPEKDDLVAAGIMEARPRLSDWGDGLMG